MSHPPSNLLFQNPSDTCYTIYTKSGCSYCVKAKKLLEKEKDTVLIINCDDYLIENKELFLDFIKEKNHGKEMRTFPIIFYKNQFIGGYTELATFYEKESAFELSTSF
jgi:glutaredoxin